MTTFRVVKKLRPLRETPDSRLDVLVVEGRKGERRLDIRKFIKTATYEGPTQKGVNLSAEEFEALMEQREAIAAALDGGS